MTFSWRQSTDFINFFKMVQVLNVAAVMPAKHVRLLAVDQVRHCLDPVWALQRCQPSVLCILNNLEDITTFERVTIITDAALYSLKLAASLALFSR
jgi:hypothetical protein